jgi:hypothetical protein
MIHLLKKTSTLLLLIALLLGGCKKTDTANPDNDLYALRQHVKSKLTAQEYSNINWGSVKKSVIANNEAVYTFRYTNDAHALLTVSTNRGNYAAQTFTYSIANQVVSTTLTNLESGKVKLQNKTVDEIVKGGGRPPIVPNTPGVTLPEVVLVAYINNNIPNLSTPHATDLMMFISTGGGGFNYQQELASLDPNSSNYGQSPILGPVLEFGSAEEALEFLRWVESLNPLELLLLAQNPWVAPFLSANTEAALAKAKEWAATKFPNDPAKQAASLNGGQADAIRHAYWVALNRSDIGETLATLFANAHEFGATKPASMPQAAWDLDRQMDLNNNAVGIAFGNGYYPWSTASSMWTKLVEKSTETGSPVYTGLKYICNGVLIHFYENCP